MSLWVSAAICCASAKESIELDAEVVHRVARALQQATIRRRLIAGLVNPVRFLAPGAPGRGGCDHLVNALGIGCDVAQRLEQPPELAVEPFHLTQDGGATSRIPLEQKIPVHSPYALDGLLGLERELGKGERLLVAGARALVQSIHASKRTKPDHQREQQQTAEPEEQPAANPHPEEKLEHGDDPFR